jgi:sugar phosphate permease
MRKSVLAVAAAVSMISVSSGALAQSAAPLSVAANVRAGADMKEASDYRGGFIIPALAVLLIGVLVYVLTKHDSPTSP